METAERRRGALSREQIARAALALVDREGIDALTMRRVAAEVGASPMGLYRHFRGKEELVEAIVEAASGEESIDLSAEDWQTQLRELGRAIHRILERHPATVQLRLRRPIQTPAALRVTEAGVQILRRAGFSRAEAARAFRTLFLYAFAYAAFNTPESPDETRRETLAALHALPPEEFPELTGGAEEAADVMSGEEQFEFGLDLLITALEARLAAAGRGP